MVDVNFLRKKLIAHRGLFDKNNNIPENSIIAFEQAIKYGYSIELDVHLLNDGKIVVFHDDNLKRMTGIDKKVKDCNYDEIKKLKLDNTDCEIPLFEDVLKLVDKKVPILIEIKNDRKTGETERELIKLLKNYKGKYAIQSFNPFSLIWFKKNYPNIPRGQLASDFSKDKMLKIQKYILKNLYLNFLTKPDFVSYSINSFPNKKVSEFRKMGKLVLGWTVKTKSDYKNAKKYCDNIIGENLQNLDI